MAYNNGFPVGYPYYQAVQPYQQMVQQPVQQIQQPQAMTPPTIHAEIVQVDGEEAAAGYPVAAGASQMMMARDDSAIYVKTAFANGQSSLDVFVKRPPAPPAPVFDPGEYVTRDELEKRLSALLGARSGKKKEETE